MIGELNNIAYNYKVLLEQLMDKYNIAGSIFMIKNQELNEVENGYFEVVKECDDLNEAVKECWGKFNERGIMIIENEKFLVGEVKSQLTQCNRENKIFDVNCKR